MSWTLAKILDGKCIYEYTSDTPGPPTTLPDPKDCPCFKPTSCKCGQWMNCGRKDGGCCKLNLFNGKPTFVQCNTCEWNTDKIMSRPKPPLQQGSAPLFKSVGSSQPPKGCAQCNRNKPKSA